jgi:hypothetical protein
VLSADRDRQRARQVALENIRSRADVLDALRAYHLHPVTIFCYLFPLSILLTGLMKPEFDILGLSPFASDLLTAAKVVVFWLFSYFFLGRLCWLALQRGLPIFVVPLMLWIVAVVLSQALTSLIFNGYDLNMVRIYRQSVLGLPGLLFSFYAATPMMREKMGHIPDLVPIWTRPQPLSDVLLLHLPPEKRGRIRRIHAANQYITVVTDKGEAMLRMGLSTAAALMPEKAGWLCHRSLWIARDEVAALSFTKGQPKIVDQDGTTYPISRAAVPEIRAYLIRTKGADAVAKSD